MSFEHSMEEQRNALVNFLNNAGARMDVHEPDEQGITGTVTGTHLDNAMGADPGSGEFVLTLERNGERLSLNVATMLAMLTHQYRGNNGGVHMIACEDPKLTRAQQAAYLHSNTPYCPKCGSEAELAPYIHYGPEDNTLLGTLICDKHDHRFRVVCLPVSVQDMNDEDEHDRRFDEMMAENEEAEEVLLGLSEKEVLRFDWAFHSNDREEEIRKLASEFGLTYQIALAVAAMA